jgi:2-oxoglutarate ferredoxin oxidoreductase subunit beta
MATAVTPVDSATSTLPVKYSPKDFASSQDPRWCPGCGDYSILAQVQRIMPELGIPREKLVFVSGIGCSSRFPYYMETYGFHGIHGRATAIASGVKLANPDLSVWVVTGDGDGLSIGGNHTIHLLRRNLDIKVLLFNNQIYGLTKGQYSPTSEFGKITKSTPYGSIDYPFHPILVALGSSGTFVARTMDRDPKHLQYVLRRAAEHKGTSFIEIYQNCNVFNDGTFELLTEKETRDDYVVYLEHGKPLLFGKERKRGIRLNGSIPEAVTINNGTYTVDDVVVYNEKDLALAFIMATMMDYPDLPRPVGIFHVKERLTYEDAMTQQIAHARVKYGTGNLKTLFDAGDTWTIK